VQVILHFRKSHNLKIKMASQIMLFSSITCIVKMVYIVEAYLMIVRVDAERPQVKLFRWKRHRRLQFVDPERLSVHRKALQMHAEQWGGAPQVHSLGGFLEVLAFWTPPGVHRGQGFGGGKERETLR
jgi:hypothetical protein